MPDPAARGGAIRLAIRRTPCVGVCSTTYGDLVCRGCKRFAHEIVAWNGYQDSQRDVVWRRLYELLAQSVNVYLTIADEGRLRNVAREARIADADTLPAEVLAFRTMGVRPLPLAALGLAANDLDAEGASAAVAGMTTRDAWRTIDREFYTRSRAHYEVSFKTLT